jgi:tetratricopeptide (TPR) repeat protein
MRSSIEDLKLQFAGVKNGEIPAIDLFKKIWETGQALPKNELKVLADEVLEWTEKKQKEDPASYGFALSTIGYVDFFSERHESSIKNNLAALQIFEELNNPNGIAVCQVLKGAVFRALGDIDLALQCFTEAWEVLSTDTAFNFLTVISAYNQAEIYAVSNHFDDSVKFYQFTLVNGKEYFYIFPLFLSGLAMVYHKQKQDELSEQYLNQALNLCRENESIPFTVSRILSELGTYYFDLGNYDEAISKHQESLKLRTDANILGGAVTNMLQIAKIYSLQHKDIEGIQILTRALEMAESIHVKPKMAEVHHLLSTIYEKLGETQRSLEHHKEFFRINEQVSNEDAEKKIKNMLLIFEAEHTRKENSIIRAQKKEIELKNRELRHTIDELTLTKISRKAKAISFTIAIALFILEDTIIHFVVTPIVHENYLFSLGANGVIIFCIKPIEKLIEHNLLHKFVMQKKILSEIQEDTQENIQNTMNIIPVPSAQ